MKRCFLFICISILICAVLCACGSDKKTDAGNSGAGDVTGNGTKDVPTLEKDFSSDYPGSYETLVFGFSDSVPSLQVAIEYDFADREKYKEQEPEQMVDVLVNGKQYSAEYWKTVYRSYHYYPEYEYMDADNQVFTFDDTGMLTGCFWGSSLQKGEKKTKEACLQIAKDFISEIIDIDAYEISITDNADSEQYIVTFTKYVNGIKTTDGASVKVQYDGTLYSYSSFMLGRIHSEALTSDIDVKAAASVIIKRLDEIFADAKSKYSRVEYGEYSYSLTILKDGSTALVWYVDVNCIQEYEKHNISKSERIQFVVPID